jgi:hypothetical protein
LGKSKRIAQQGEPKDDFLDGDAVRFRYAYLMNENEWSAKVEEWRQIYGTERTPRSNDPNPTRVALRFCYRCGKNKRRMARHHIRSDFFFACLLPDVYAKQYILFRDEDITWLCDACHGLAHRRYRKVKKEFWKKVNEEDGGIVTEERCEEFKTELARVFKVWIKNYRERTHDKRKR